MPFARIGTAIRGWAELNPVPAAAFLLISGIAAGFAAAPACDAYPAAAFAAALFALAGAGWARRPFYALAVFALGAALAMRTEAARADAEEALTSRSGAGAPECVLEVLADAAAPRRPPRNAAGESWEFPARHGGMELQVAVAGAPAGTPAPRAGEKWRCRGWLARRRPGRSAYARRRFSCNFARGGGAERVAAADGRSPSAILRKIRAVFSRNAAIGLEDDPETAALNRAMLLGESSSLPHAKRKTFIDAGTMHVFAISGLHVGLVALALGSVLRFAGMRQEFRAAVMIPALFSYAILAGARPSAIRAAFMAALYLGAPFAGRRPDPMFAWSATALFVYARRPELFYDPGCALSFTVMFGIVLWCGWRRSLPPLWKGIDGKTAALRLAGRHKAAWVLHAARTVLSRTVSLFALSAAAWFAGVPPSAAIFGRVTPAALVSGAPVCALATVTVVLGMFGAAAACASETAAAAFNLAAAAGTKAMEAVSGAAARLPFASVEVEKWGAAQCAAWYLCVFACAAVAGALVARRRGLAWIPRRARTMEETR